MSNWEDNDLTLCTLSHFLLKHGNKVQGSTFVCSSGYKRDDCLLFIFSFSDGFILASFHTCLKLMPWKRTSVLSTSVSIICIKWIVKKHMSKLTNMHFLEKVCHRSIFWSNMRPRENLDLCMSVLHLLVQLFLSFWIFVLNSPTLQFINILEFSRQYWVCWSHNITVGNLCSLTHDPCSILFTTWIC